MPHPLRLSLLSSLVLASPLAGQTPTAEQREYAAALGAHHICSGVFVVGRDYQRTPDSVLAQDLARFPAFLWQADFAYAVDWDRTAVTVTGKGIPPRSARYHDDQGCTILPRGESDVFFAPVDVESILPDPLTQPWPMGDLHATQPLAGEPARRALDAALDWGMAQPDQNTRAIAVVYKGKIVGERYAPGFTGDTPQISWSMGKSITAALIGVLVQQGHFHWNDPAPVPEWRVPGDPRGAITIGHLLRMSSGLDFKNYGLNGPESYSPENEHFLIYFGAPHVFRHAVNQPLAFAPDEEWRYKNSDPLMLGSIVRQTVEARGESYLTFPQRHLFDKIGARHYVLETDSYGNFIMTGYDFGSARDWARFGLLHLWDGVFEGERVLPEGWTEFITTPAPADRRRGYGGLWWLNRGGAMSRAPEDAYWAAGYMGQRTMVIPSRNVVIVRLGPSARGFNQYFNEFVGRVLEVVGS